MANQSLYRRYRPRRFSEVKGQDHVVKALRTAVAEGREGQAYLFSGPRGTGKTTSARILAKVLNCERPVDGEPCCECPSCIAVERGTSYDVHELDAASNNGVDAMRDLIEKASLGTPGRHKVYILDEVHMLSKAAEAALLKTLEEPPPHVVFVLATTDPQKMSDTIRSRTQHLQFHLLNTDILSEHVRWVAADAGLDVSEAAVEQVLRQGAGSARDALSALELAATVGDAGLETVPLDEFVEAMIDRDPGRALTMVAHAISIGRDPRTLTEELIRFMRNEFLCLMAPELAQVSGQHIDVLTDQANRVGAASLVRGIELLGSSLTDMRHAPDPRVLLDVAAVQLTADTVAPDVGALLARLHRLEEQIAAGMPATAGASASDVAAAPVATSGRAVLGGRARVTATPEPVATSAGAQSSAAADVPADPAARPVSDPGPPSPKAGVGAPMSNELWEQTVRPGLRGMARAVYAPATLLTSTDDTVTFSLPNVVHREKCEQHREAVEAAIRTVTGRKSDVRLVVEGEAGHPDAAPAVQRPEPSTPAAPSAPSPASTVEAPGDPGSIGASDPHDTVDPPRPAGSSMESRNPSQTAVGAPSSPIDDPIDDEDVDLDDLVDVPPESVKSPIERLAEAFPGSELIDERT
jgi:DNA polymerase-3 subunit gamma/tau